MSISEEIVARAVSLSDADEERLTAICAAVQQYLCSRLKSGVSTDECYESFVYAAALMAVSIVKTLDDDALSGLDAGTLKLTFDKRTDHLSAIAERLLAPWCARDEFAFCGVGS